jgi:hypothetical protein
MTDQKFRAVDIIGSCAGITQAAVADLFTAYSLATGITVEEDVLWDDLPLGMGSDLISFVQSMHYPGSQSGATYGHIARCWLLYRGLKLAK